MTIKRRLTSKFYGESIVTGDHFHTLRISPGLGEMEEVPAVQIKISAFPGKSDLVVVLPKSDAFEVARDIIRAHRGPAEYAEHRKSGLLPDHVGIHAMSEAEALMIEAIMSWEDRSLRLQAWSELAKPGRAQAFLEFFVTDPEQFEKFVRGEFGELGYNPVTHKSCGCPLGRECDCG